MKPIQLAFAGLLAFAPLGMMPALAQDAADPGTEILDLTDPVNFREALDAMGRATRTDRNSTGRPQLVVTKENFNYRLTFYGCEEDISCAHVAVATYYEVADPFPLDVANNWNGKEFVGAIWIDSDGYPWLLETFNLIGGQTRQSFEDQILWWEDHIGYFTDFVSEHENAKSIGKD